MIKSEKNSFQRLIQKLRHPVIVDSYHHALKQIFVEFPESSIFLQGVPLQMKAEHCQFFNKTLPFQNPHVAKLGIYINKIFFFAGVL